MALTEWLRHRSKRQSLVPVEVGQWRDLFTASLEPCFPVRRGEGGRGVGYGKILIHVAGIRAEDLRQVHCRKNCSLVVGETGAAFLVTTTMAVQSADNHLILQVGPEPHRRNRFCPARFQRTVGRLQDLGRPGGLLEDELILDVAHVGIGVESRHDAMDIWDPRSRSLAVLK